MPIRDRQAPINALPRREKREERKACAVHSESTGRGSGQAIYKEQRTCFGGASRPRGSLGELIWQSCSPSNPICPTQRRRRLLEYARTRSATGVGDGLREDSRWRTSRAQDGRFFS